MVNITTIDGRRIDLAKKTIEINMGGLSLLKLDSRDGTYTNSISLPKTPNNEIVLDFASSPTKRNRPQIDVIISSGTFQRKAILTVLNIGKEYNCSLKYSDAISKLKNCYYQRILKNKVLSATNITVDLLARTLCGAGYDGIYYLRDFYNEIATTYKRRRTLYIKTSRMLQIIATNTGVNFSGDLLSNVDFLNSYVNLNKLYVADGVPILLGMSDTNQDTLTAADLIKQICLLFMCDIRFDGDNVIINFIDFNKSELRIEGFNLEDKKIKSGLANQNIITYDVNKKLTDNATAQDIFTADGEGTTEGLNLGLYIPLLGLDGSTSLFNLYEDEDTKTKMIIAVGIQESNKTINMFSQTFTNVSVKRAAILSLSGFYSNILNPIFANPVIIEASRYIDPITADTIMNNRVITSVQLGGRYWVDTMAYNLTTGQSKLTLIKLP